MKKSTKSPYSIQSISDLHRLLDIPRPGHPLVSVIDLSKLRDSCKVMIGSYVYQFYSICIKKDFNGKMKYGQRYYDFDDGVMTFFSPGQVISTEVTEEVGLNGWWLVFHPDFVRQYPLSRKVKEYGFFSYNVSEALHLSQKEEEKLAAIMQDIHEEYQASIDTFSQDVMIAHIDLLLSYSNRFYNRQFITRRAASDDLLVRLEQILGDYFDSNKTQELGLRTVHYISEELHVSPNYLSDMLRVLTGQSTQQHIHDKLIEKAKEMLSTSSLSVTQVAFQLGFEYPQSFSKLFKSKTELSPMEFRHSFEHN